MTFLMANCLNDGIAFPLVLSMISSERDVEGAHLWPRFPVLACVSGVIQLVESNQGEGTGVFGDPYVRPHTGS